MDPGQLNRSIVFKTQSTTKDGHGQQSTNYTTLVTVLASVRDLNIRERVVASEDVAQNVKIFTIRYRAGISTDLVIEYNGFVWDIEGINEMGQQNKQWLEIFARSIGAAVPTLAELNRGQLGAKTRGELAGRVRGDVSDPTLSELDRGQLQTKTRADLNERIRGS